MINWKIIKVVLLTLTTIICTAAQTLSLPLWFSSGDKMVIRPMFILLYSSFCFVVFFTIIFVFMNCTQDTRKFPVPTINKHFMTMVLLGFFTSLNGYGAVYAAPTSRTPAIIQVVMTNSTIFFGIPATKLFVPSKKNMKYTHYLVYLSLGCVFLGIFMALLPDLILAFNGGSVSKENPGVMFLWILLFTSGMAMASMANVFQERFFSSRSSFENRNEAYERQFMLFWSCLFQLVFMIVLSPLDLIPKFGSSNSIQEFTEMLLDSFMCNFGLGGICSVNNFIYGVMFIGCFAISFVATAILNQESANFALIAGTVATPVGMIAALIIPQLKNDESTPIWSVIPSGILLLVGTIIWKYWEVKYPDQGRKKQYMSIQEEKK
eukprot:TRINITY_DN9855_c0_g1_i1.p1 TRINITY_DN9855_c0_g1~~TRINITY_DN9855_c0_g1_i1.p1  ORF type:complete len:378 (-),score=48.60 TRINITY_DN9855_c0_g1_i1:98-1231(-)